MAKTRTIGLDSHRSKRDFTVTPEPPPASNAPVTKRLFVVQKHQAHRAGLHWDFRLEHNDVLWSWAVRKGPSLDPADKRIAVHVEDHPLDYADFQGSIPEGHYGAGTVATWDRGSWERLNGKFTLVRLKPRPNQRGRQDNWLLIKGHDAAEKPGADAEALEAAIDFPPASPRGRGGSKAGGSKPGGPKAGASARPPEAEPGSSAPTGKAGGAAPADVDAGSAKT